MSTTTRIEKGTLYVNGGCLGPAERDPVTGTIEQGPHVTARAAKPRDIAVLRVDHSPMPNETSMTITRDTITDAQILELRRSLWGRCSREDWTAIGDALLPPELAATADISGARARCAEILNTHAKGIP